MHFIEIVKPTVKLIQAFGANSVINLQYHENLIPSTISEQECEANVQITTKTNQLSFMEMDKLSKRINKLEKMMKRNIKKNKKVGVSTLNFTEKSNVRHSSSRSPKKVVEFPEDRTKKSVIPVVSVGQSDDILWKMWI